MLTVILGFSTLESGGLPYLKNARIISNVRRCVPLAVSYMSCLNRPSVIIGTCSSSLPAAAVDQVIATTAARGMSKKLLKGKYFAESPTAGILSGKGHGLSSHPLYSTTALPATLKPPKSLHKSSHSIRTHSTTTGISAQTTVPPSARSNTSATPYQRHNISNFRQFFSDDAVFDNFSANAQSAQLPLFSQLEQQRSALRHGFEQYAATAANEAVLSQDLSTATTRLPNQATIEEDAYMDPRPPFCLSPSVPGFQDTSHIFAGFSPFSMGMCGPAFVLERLGPHILRSHVSTVQFKPIPNDINVNLDAFRFREPCEWSLDDVIGWMISVAKKYNIPIDDMNMHRFADCNGPLLNLMTQQSFVERDPNYGHVLYVEFRRLLGDEAESNILDTLIAAAAENTGPSTSGHTIISAAIAAATANSNSNLAPPTTKQSVKNVARKSPNHLSPRPASGSGHSTASVIKVNPSAGSGNIKKKSTKQKAAGNGAEKLTSLSEKCLKDIDGLIDSVVLSPTSGVSTGSGKEPKKRKDGKPRRRSQHTKGNKLWEFIRDALKDPETCPTVVRWEDSDQGVFRIVESEKLAKLWGEKKNNQKMTYEKLSRAMRTYYEKKILVPVPKTGLYPKKLVYKFGPNAVGWHGPQSSTSISKSSSTTAQAASGQQHRKQQHQQQQQPPQHNNEISAHNAAMINRCKSTEALLLAAAEEKHKLVGIAAAPTKISSISPYISQSTTNISSGNNRNNNNANTPASLLNLFSSASQQHLAKSTPPNDGGTDTDIIQNIKREPDGGGDHEMKSGIGLSPYSGQPLSTSHHANMLLAAAAAVYHESQQSQLLGECIAAAVAASGGSTQDGKYQLSPSQNSAFVHSPSDASAMLLSSPLQEYGNQQLLQQQNQVIKHGESEQEPAFQRQSSQSQHRGSVVLKPIALHASPLSPAWHCGSPLATINPGQQNVLSPSAACASLAEGNTGGDSNGRNNAQNRAEETEEELMVVDA